MFLGEITSLCLAELIFFCSKTHKTGRHWVWGKTVVFFSDCKWTILMDREKGVSNSETHTYAPPPNGQNLHEKERFEVRLAADSYRQDRGGRDSRGGIEEKETALRTCFCGLLALWVDCNWDEWSGELDFLIAEVEMVMWKVKREKNQKPKKKKSNKRETSLLLLPLLFCVISKCLMAVTQAVLPSFSSFSSLAHTGDNMKVSIRFASICLILIHWQKQHLI